MTRIGEQAAESMEATATMLPCPWCDSTDVDASFGMGPNTVSAGCMKCGMCGPDSNSATEAASKWNALPRKGTARPEELFGTWRDPKDKPPHLPGEHHSADVLICMRTDPIRGEAIRIGHVSLGHWRPRGGNGNFDADVLGWMPLPAPLPQSERS